MSFEVRDTNTYKEIIAPTLEDVRLALNHLHESGFDLNVGWHGWDDESIIAHTKTGLKSLFIEPEAK